MVGPTAGHLYPTIKENTMSDNPKMVRVIVAQNDLVSAPFHAYDVPGDQMPFDPIEPYMTEEQVKAWLKDDEYWVAEFSQGTLFIYQKDDVEKEHVHDYYPAYVPTVDGDLTLYHIHDFHWVDETHVTHEFEADAETVHEIIALQDKLGDHLVDIRFDYNDGDKPHEVWLWLAVRGLLLDDLIRLLEDVPDCDLLRTSLHWSGTQTDEVELQQEERRQVLEQEKGYQPKYVIFSEKETTAHPENGPAFWNNETGWTALAEATIFSQKEMMELYLPVGGEWVTLPNVDQIWE